jgi:hypothetical protein
MDRRDFLKYLGGVAALGALSGCGGGTSPDKVSYNNQPLFKNFGNIPFLPRRESGPQPPQTTTPSVSINDIVADIPLAAYSRSVWHANLPVRSRMNPMGYVNRITLHHDGSPQGNYDTSVSQVATTLRRIQSEHRKRMQAGDIGYHYIVDRSGNIWEGRNPAFQGAHVKDKNPHNLGVMMLGNFEKQRPTTAQLNSLQNLCHTLVKGYNIQPNNIYAHRELASTCCPGRIMLPYVTQIRGNLRSA